MAKILAILDVNSDGHVVRLSDGSTATLPHGGPVPTVGEELLGPPTLQFPPTIEQLNSPEQLAANILSEQVLHAEATADRAAEREEDAREEARDDRADAKRAKGK